MIILRLSIINFMFRNCIMVLALEECIIQYCLILSKPPGPCGMIGFGVEGKLSWTIQELLDSEKAKERDLIRFRFEGKRDHYGNMVDVNLIPGKWFDFTTNKDKTLLELGFDAKERCICFYNE